MDTQPLTKSIHESFAAFLEKADINQLRLIEYAMKGIADGNLRDLSWVIGRKAGRIHIAQS